MGTDGTLAGPERLATLVEVEISGIGILHQPLCCGGRPDLMRPAGTAGFKNALHRCYVGAGAKETTNEQGHEDPAER